MATGMIIDGVLGSQCVDSSGEILDVEGADISDLEEGRGVLNYEHKGSEDAANNGQEIVGKILTAKKVMKEADCDNGRQRAYWKKVKHPFVYGVCRLYDGAGHEGAKALAAQIRDHAANGEPILVRFSVEGSTLEKDGNILKRSVIRRVALTLKPCNRTADSGLLEDPNAPTGFEKNPVQKVGDLLADLTSDAKKMEHEHPGYQKLGGSTDVEYLEFTDSDREGLTKLVEKVLAIRKALATMKGEVIHGNFPAPSTAPSKEATGEPAQVVSIGRRAVGEQMLQEGDEDARAQELDKERRLAMENSLEQRGAVRLPNGTRVHHAVYGDGEVQSTEATPMSFIHHVLFDKDNTDDVLADFFKPIAVQAHELTPHVKKGEAPVAKALTAGVGDVAPSQLSGGAALQREDHVKFKKKAMGVLKTFLDKNDDFTRDQARAVFKQELPEASDEFLDHFAGIAEDYKLKLRKDEAGGSPFPEKNPAIGGGIGGDDTRVKIPKVQDPVRGPVTDKSVGSVKADKKGGLDMEPGGKLLLGAPGRGIGARRVSVQQHFPDDPLYKAILDPHWGLENQVITQDQHDTLMKTVHTPWHRAMAHWMPMNKALSEGRVPKSVIAKSVIFAAMSPNTSVPLQERYYGHYMDMLYEGKVDPLKPISEDAIREFTARSTSGVPPEWNRDYYTAHPIGIGAGADEEDEGASDKGELPQILGLRNAHLVYPLLEHLTAKHKDDTQQIAAELMDMKAEHNRHKLKTDADRRQGRTNIVREAPDHPRTLGFGPKLTRYLLGMFGGGNMIVPDRHMVRSSFDLKMIPDPEHPGKSRGEPILEKLQTAVVTKAHNERFLRAIDHNFFVHHPAVRHVLNQFPKHFAGREAQATFPAFWLHWLTIKHYDEMRGRPSMAFNTDTDHMVFWDSVRDDMIKHGLEPHPIHDARVLEKSLDPWKRHDAHLDVPVWIKAAGCMEAIRQKWGENPALLAFFSHIAPKLMAAETPVPPVTHRPHPAYTPTLMKMEGLLIDLRKAMADAAAGDQALAEVAPHVHHVYAYHVAPDLSIKRHPAGRFMTAGNHLNILEDYHGHLGELLKEGPMDQEKLAAIESLKHHPKLDVASMHEISSGARPELWGDLPKRQPVKPVSVFEIARPDQERSDRLEFKDGAPHLNGYALKPDQVQALMHHVKNGHAAIRYSRVSPQAVQKMEQLFGALLKADDPQMAGHVNEALSALDQLVAAGHLDPRHADILRKHAFADPMTGHVMGNKFAHTDFLNRADSKQGVHISMDGNDFKSINDKYGHEVGDQAIKAMGRAMREAMDESVGPDKGKLFRSGGDEFAAHVPTHEHAAAFARALRAKLEAIPPIAGQHKLSMGIGIGLSHEHADQALYEAKKQKYDPAGMIGNDSRKWIGKYTPGEAPSLAHSLVPGFEGAVPLDATQLNIKPPPAPQPRPPAPAPVVPAAPKPTAAPKAVPTPAAPTAPKMPA